MQLSNDVKNIKKNPQLLIPGDKTNYLYEVTSEEYNKLLHENICNSYNKTIVSAINAISTEGKAIAKDLNLDERIEQYKQNQIFHHSKRSQEKFSEKFKMQTNKSCKIKNRNCKQTLHRSHKQIN